MKSCRDKIMRRHGTNTELQSVHVENETSTRTVLFMKSKFHALMETSADTSPSLKFLNSISISFAVAFQTQILLTQR
jgi:hypothetical protein